MSPLLIGVGNAYRRDDGVGPLVLQHVAARCPQARLVEAWGEGAALMETWRDEDAVVIVDAARPAGNPGRVVRMDASRVRVPASLLFLSTHLFGVAEAVETARALGTLPPSVVLYAVEGADFSWGEGPTPAVAAAVLRVAARVVGEAVRVQHVGARRRAERGGGGVLRAG